MTYIVFAIILFSLMLVYFKIADKYNIVDKPNERSSHTQITLRGGGVIFWAAALCYFITHISENYLFFIAITIIAFVSFYDDIKSLGDIPRLIAHLVSMTLSFYFLNVFGEYPIWAILIAYIIFIGIINAYNFMDGINGITGLYSIIVFGALQYVNIEVIHYIDTDFIWFPMIACGIFLFFNMRKRAKCFAGDVGSVTIAFWIVTLLAMLIIKTNNLIWILFLTVYGVDTICTILHRLYLKQNIFKAHRMHFYQVLVNECGWSHISVSILYAFIQLIICILIISNPFNSYYGIILATIIPLLIIYLLKFKLKKRFKCVD